MNVRPKLAPEQQLTIEEFLAFTETRPASAGRKPGRIL